MIANPNQHNGNVAVAARRLRTLREGVKDEGGWRHLRNAEEYLWLQYYRFLEIN